MAGSELKICTESNEKMVIVIVSQRIKDLKHDLDETRERNLQSKALSTPQFILLDLQRRLRNPRSTWP